MRTRAGRAGIALAALAAAGALFVVLAGGGGEGTDSAAAEPRGEHAATEGPSGAGSATAKRRSPRRASAREPKARKVPPVERIVVRGGKPVGGIERLEYERGERVRFAVHADVEEEVHVHGFDLEKEVDANESVRFSFLADLEGVFEVELHERHVKIAELRITP